MSELITQQMLLKYGLSDLSPSELDSLTDTVFAIVANRLTVKLLDSLSDEEATNLENVAAADHITALMQLAEIHGMTAALEAQTEATLHEIALKTGRIR